MVAVADKIDFVKQDKKLYYGSPEPEIMAVPKMRYLMIDGEGAPEGNPRFQQAMGALFGVAYTIRFMGKKGPTPAGYREFKVAPVEGLWWMDDGTEFDQARPADWRWTLLIRMPEFVDTAVVSSVIADLVEKKKDTSYMQVRVEDLAEGRAVQLLHVGPYDAEGPNLDKMVAYTKGQGYAYTGKHHEIYLGDPRRTAPDKLKTLLRHPVAKRRDNED